MLQEDVLSPDTRRLIESIGSPVTNEDIAIYERIRQIEDSSYRLRAVVAAWEKQQTEERDLRSRYAKWLVMVMLVQFVVINIAFFLIGFGLISIEEWVASSFIGGVLLEISSMIFVVVRYLFPTNIRISLPRDIQGDFGGSEG